MADKADKKKREQERIKKQLLVLGVMLILVLVVNRDKILGKGGTKTAAQTVRPAGQLAPAAAASSAVSPSSAPAVAAAEAPSASAGGPAQTPYEIPALTPEVVDKLKARREKRPLNPDEVDTRKFEKTVDPFTSFEFDRDQFAAAESGVRQPASPTPSARTLPGPKTAAGDVPANLKSYRSFGVMVLDGEKQAIIKKDGRVVPYHLKDGDRLEGSEDNFKVNITGDNRVMVEDTEAVRADEKLFELGAAGPPRIVEGIQGGSAPSGAPTTGSSGAPPPGAEPPVVFLDENF